MEVAFLTPDQASQLTKESEERAARARAAAVAKEKERAELKVVQRAKALECRAARDGITALKRDLETLEANLQADAGKIAAGVGAPEESRKGCTGRLGLPNGSR